MLFFLYLFDCIIFLGIGWLWMCPVPSYFIPQRVFLTLFSPHCCYFFFSFFFSNVEFHLLGKWSVKLEQKLQIIVPFGRRTAESARQRVSLGESGGKVSWTQLHGWICASVCVRCVWERESELLPVFVLLFTVFFKAALRWPRDKILNCM